MFLSFSAMRRQSRFAATGLALLSMVVSGCAGLANAGNKSAAATVSVSLSPSSANLQAGTGTQVFTATVQNNVNGDGVTWSLSGTGCSGATCGAISSTSSASGGSITYTAPANIPNPATVTVTATAVADTTKSSSATITITTPISVTVTPSTASVQVGQTASFKASISKDSQNKGVTWTLSGTGCTGSACGTLSATSSSNGSSITYTAPATAPSPATVTLTATSVTDPLRTSSATITITTPATIGVTVAPATASVQTSGTQAFTATVANDTQNKGVTWALSGAGCSGATCGTLSAASSASGTAITYTAPASVPSPATVTLTATSVTDGTKFGTAAITVTAAPVIAVSIAPTTASVQAGIGAQSFTATVTNDTQNKGVNWALSGTGCSGATCGSLSATTSASGTAITYTAPTNAPAPALVTLTATSVSDGTKSGSAAITVTPAVAVSIAPTSASVQTGLTQTFTATVSNDAQNKGVSWTLSGTGCTGTACGTLSTATSASGVAVTYTAPSSVSTPATVTIKATSVTDTTRSASATITVTAAPAIAVSVAPTAASVQAGIGTQSFTATVTNDTQNKGVNWALSGTGCSGVTCGALSATSSASGTAITYTAPTNAPSPATMTLTATSVSDATKSAATTITVTPAVAVSIAPTSASVQTGLTQNFTATVSNDAQNKGVTWSLSGTGCTGTTCGTLSATSSASGTAITYTAPASVPTPATVTIQANSVTDATRGASSTITVTATPVIVVAVAPTTPSVQAVIGTQSFTATVTNDSQNKGVNWTLSGAGCSGATCGTLSATSSASGAAITYTAPTAAPSPATVTLTATSAADGTKVGTATITITAAVSVSVAPTSASVQTGLTQAFTATVLNDAQNKGVSWMLSGAGCSGATCGTLSATTSASGTAITYTAPSSVPTPATVTLTATSVRDGSKTAAATITVTAASAGPISVSITPRRGGLTLGQALGFTATVTNDVGNAGVTWMASSGSFSTQNTFAATYVAPNTAGVITVTATSVADGSKSATATLGVTDLTGVTTYHNDLSRDGVNAKEYALTTTNVTPPTFGKLFSCAADAAIYAQPLWVANLSIGGGMHNVIFAATVHDTVYAFDADANPCVTYWRTSLLGSGETWLANTDVGSSDIYPDIGIIGTPVIDPATNTIYVVSKSKTSGTNCTPATSCFQRLHALSLIDGTEKFGGPTNITSAISVPGTGDGSSGGVVTFNTLREHQRPGLVLSNGVVYVAFASHGDNAPYHGWVLGYNASTLALVATFNANPNGSDAGIWMSGGAPAVDASGNLYFLTGNGTFDANTSGGLDYGDSTVKLSTSGGLSVAGYFTPADQASLQGGDTDHGSGGAAILVDQPATAPHQHLVIGGGKEGNMFLLDRDNMGGYGANFSPADSNAVQKFSVGNGIFSTAAFFNNSLYVAGVGGHLKAFAFNTGTGQFNGAQTSQSPGTFGFPGATPSISATGTGNAIAWAMDSSVYGTYNGGSRAAGPTILHAYDATNLATELWNSSQASGSRDQAGNGVKFTLPTVANGKVYVGTRGNDSTTGAGTVFGEIDVYGLLP